MKPKKKEKKQTMLEVAHEMAKGLRKAELIDAIAMQEFDELCFSSVENVSSTKAKPTCTKKT